MAVTAVVPGAPAHPAGTTFFQFAADASGVGETLGRFLDGPSLFVALAILTLVHDHYVRILYLHHILRALLAPGVCLGWMSMKKPPTSFRLFPVQVAYELEVLHRFRSFLLDAARISHPAAADSLPRRELCTHGTSN